MPTPLVCPGSRFRRRQQIDCMPVLHTEVRPSSFGPSVIAARKSLYVSGGSGCPSDNGRERNAERRVVNTPRRISRIAGKQRHTATPLGAPPRRLIRPWDRASGTGASELAIQAGFRPPFTCPVQPLKAEPHNGPGRLPKAPRVRRETSPPRPQAPHPFPRYEASQVTPLPWDRMPRSIHPRTNIARTRHSTIREYIPATSLRHSGATARLRGRARNP
jgi:hypothetical protein